MSTKITTKNGKVITLLNPSEMGAKYADELRFNTRLTNDGYPKLTDKNEQLPLTPEQRAYRSGWLDAQKASAKAYKSRQRKNRP